ncbi:hypothetical protein J437_LFUL012001 [Ladona fulva]|uniref:Chitin-binding type-2 domain-containing protein n=1 Tax=Ladona fulva TaxID=123851 RepID=A0A8K0JZU9_LADFU|nr:hypothetical protein J437_LFUL012001 [Ladona fulva]
MSAQIYFFIFVAALSEVLSQDPRTCTRVGIQCSDCQTLSECVKDADGLGYHYERDRKCPLNVVCDEFALYCELDGYCRHKEFECPSQDYDTEIVFPHPYYCNKYYGCLGPDKYSYICDEGTAFNPTTKDCSLPADAYICIDYPIPLCEVENFIGDIPNSDYMYICRKELEPLRLLYPEIHLKSDPPLTSTMEPSTSTN